MEFFTIGVYNSTKEEFFNKLIINQIDTFCDVRRRRGVRGSKYSFVNSKKLQQLILEYGMNYCHYLDLAPTIEIRNIQKENDLNNSIKKSSRLTLGEAFIENYNAEILDKFNFENLLIRFQNQKAKKVVFFCVEENHEACHRSIITNRLKETYNYTIKHL